MLSLNIRYNLLHSLVALTLLLPACSNTVEDVEDKATQKNFSVGGKVSGLMGGTLIIQNNSNESLTINDNGDYVFLNTLEKDSQYNVTVLTHPSDPNQVCTVSNEVGVISRQDINNIQISCNTSTYSVGYRISGLITSSTIPLVIQNNNSNDKIITTNGIGIFDPPSIDGSTYSISILNQPQNPSQTCLVTNSSGVLAGESVANVVIDCTVNNFSVGGSIAGLEGNGLILLNNGGNNQPIPAGISEYTFPAQVDGSSYNVTVLQQPINPIQSCVFSQNVVSSGVLTGEQISNIDLNCIPRNSISVTVINFNTGNTMVIQNNGTDDISVNSDGQYTFNTLLSVNSSYEVSIATPNSALKTSCSVSSANGVMAGSDISNIIVSCNDNISPEVVTTNPIDGANNILNNIIINATFDEDMLANTITQGSISLSSPLETITTGVVSYNSAGRMLSFSPGSPLRLLAPYTAQFSNNISDLAGQPLISNPLSFTTQDGAWGVPMLIDTENLGQAGSAQIAMDPLGNGIAVWDQSNGSRRNIWARYYNANTKLWGNAQIIETNDINDGNNPNIEMDASGNGIATWQYFFGTGNHEAWYNYFDATNNAWLGAQKLDNSTSTPQIAMDSPGNALAVWYQTDGVRENMWAKRFNGVTKSWGPSQLIETNDAGNAVEANVALSLSGDGLAIWRQFDGIRYNIWVNHYAISTNTWGTATNIEVEDLGDALYPKVSYDPTGNAIAVWRQWDGLRYNIWSNRYNKNLNLWGAAQLLETNNVGDANSPHIALDQSGNGIAVWNQQDNSSTWNIWSNRFDINSNSWRNPVLLESGSGNAYVPKIRIDSLGNGMAAWHQCCTFNIWSNRYSANTGLWGTAQLVEFDNVKAAYGAEIEIHPMGHGLVVWEQDGGSGRDIGSNTFYGNVAP